jgi:hypothetical protein
MFLLPPQSPLFPLYTGDLHLGHYCTTGPLLKQLPIVTDITAECHTCQCVLTVTTVWDLTQSDLHVDVTNKERVEVV